jgi:hypothetical protein
VNANDASVVDRVHRLTSGYRPVRHGGWLQFVITPLVIGIVLLLLTRLSRSDEVWWAVQQQRPPGDAIYDAIGIERNSDAFLAPLADAIASPKLSNQQLLDLANTFYRGASAQALSNVAHQLGEDYQHRPEWKYGQMYDRIKITYLMMSRARTMAVTNPNDAFLLSRGALALSVQDLELTHTPLCAILMYEPYFVTVARINEQESRRVKWVIVTFQGAVNFAKRSTTRPAMH